MDQCFRVLTVVLLISWFGWVCWVAIYQAFEWWMILGVLPGAAAYGITSMLMKRRKERKLNKSLRRYRSKNQ